MYLETKCPCCGKEIVLELDIFNINLETVKNVYVKAIRGFSREEFIKAKKEELIDTLPAEKQHAVKALELIYRRDISRKLIEDIIEAIEKDRTSGILENYPYIQEKALQK